MSLSEERLKEIEDIAEEPDRYYMSALGAAISDLLPEVKRLRGLVPFKCPECKGSGHGAWWCIGALEPRWVPGPVCEVCKGKRLVLIKASDLVVLEPFEAQKEGPK